MKKNRWMMVLMILAVSVFALGIASTVKAQEETPTTPEVETTDLPAPLVNRQMLGNGYGRMAATGSGQRLTIRQRLSDGTGAGGQYGYGDGTCLNDGVCVQNQNQQRVGNGYGWQAAGQGTRGQQFGAAQGAGQGQQLRDGTCPNLNNGN